MGFNGGGSVDKGGRVEEKGLLEVGVTVVEREERRKRSLCSFEEEQK